LKKKMVKEDSETYEALAEVENIVVKPVVQDMYDLVGSRFNKDIEDGYYYVAGSVKDWYYEWDFKTFNPNIYSHGFHQYPAKFIPQLARKILRIFTDENSVVLDNFSGSGTTLIECMLLNRKKALGIELNPFANFMSKVKTTPIKATILKENYNKIIELYSNPAYKHKIHDFYNIDFWFKKDTIKELSKLRTAIYDLTVEKVTDFFLLCMSDVIRKVSFTNHGGFKLHRSKDKINGDFNPNVIGDFEKVCTKNIKLMAQFYELVKDSKTKVEIINGDSRLEHNIPKNSVDFILTSPPYGDSRTTVAYGQFSRLSWQWISDETDIYSLDDNLLGGKNKITLEHEILNNSPKLKEQLELVRTSCSNRAKDVLSFYIDLNLTLLQAHKYLKKGKYFVLVSGNRTVKNIFLRTDLIISELAGAMGFTTEKILYRNIINKRMPAKNSPTNEVGVYGDTMLKENIIFLRKT